jgi:uncharacterized membrane-anchored protein YitT (DUF2179 family)
MSRAFGAAVLVINVLFCLLTAWTSGANREDFASRLGLGIVNAGGVNEIRAQYSGFFLAVALVCVASLLDWITRQTSFVVLGAVFGGLFMGRLVGLGLNGGVSGYGPTIVALYAIDAIGLLLAVASFILESPGKA